jgi:PPK2 family polyphosphate:nucleotide phosphotransferase
LAATAADGEQSMSEIRVADYRVEPGAGLRLSRVPSRVGQPHEKNTAKEKTIRLQQRMLELQELLYAQGTRAVLIVLQAMDAAGKDSTIRRCFGPLNPHRCATAGFKQPTHVEQAHDFLWRIHQRVPPRGTIGIFNRSHYEDILVPRVKTGMDKQARERRYGHINAFERLLTDEGTVIVKFYLHVSKDYQRQRLLRRLHREDKRWKFQPCDLEERKRWDDYIAAYEEILEHCSTGQAPWYVVPSERRWYRDLVIATVLTRTLETMNPRLPVPSYDYQDSDIV